MTFFDNLYHEAAAREHALIAGVEKLTHLTDDLVSLGRMARGLQKQYQGFVTDMVDIAREFKIPFTPDPVCPHCSDPDCPHSAPVKYVPTPSQAAMLKKFLGNK